MCVHDDGCMHLSVCVRVSVNGSGCMCAYMTVCVCVCVCVCVGKTSPWHCAKTEYSRLKNVYNLLPLWRRRELILCCIMWDNSVHLVDCVRADLNVEQFHLPVSVCVCWDLAGTKTLHNINVKSRLYRPYKVSHTSRFLFNFSDFFYQHLNKSLAKLHWNFCLCNALPSIFRLFRSILFFVSWISLYFLHFLYIISILCLLLLYLD